MYTTTTHKAGQKAIMYKEFILHTLDGLNYSLADIYETFKLYDKQELKNLYIDFVNNQIKDEKEQMNDLIQNILNSQNTDVIDVYKLNADYYIIELL